MIPKQIGRVRQNWLNIDQAMEYGAFRNRAKLLAAVARGVFPAPAVFNNRRRWSGKSLNAWANNKRAVVQNQAKSVSEPKSSKKKLSEEAFI